MNNICKLPIALAAFAAATAGAAIPEVSNVAMTQAANRLVTITYSLENGPAVVTLDIQTNANTRAAADDPGWTSIGGKYLCNAQGDVWKKVAGGQNNTITWHPDKSWTDETGEGFIVEGNGARARVTAWPLDNTPDYMVVDISAAAQPNTERYYPGADFLPGNVREWCLDWFANDISSLDGAVNLIIPSNGSRHHRGGNYQETASECRSANRNGSASTKNDWFTGFRLVCPIEAK